MKATRPGGPVDFTGRLNRLRAVDRTGCADVFDFYEEVITYQHRRSLDHDFAGNGRIEEVLPEEVRSAVGELGGMAPEPMRVAGAALIDDGELTRASVRAWLEGDESSPFSSMWFRIACAPVLELKAKSAAPSDSGSDNSSCPICRGLPLVSAIVEESGEFMHGAPRYLICSRCAYWWRFARAVCPTCGEHDPKRLESFRADAWPWARIDSCESCRSYIKTFDLREPGGNAVVPLVDDLTTLPLDLWARGQDLKRAAPTLAGI